MSYFIADVKRIYKSRMVQLTLLLMGIIAVADPLFVRFVYGRHPGFFEQVGANPFQFWLLMNSSGWGHTVYRTLLFIFPVLSTGLIFFHERHSSMYELMVLRKSRTQYLFSKVISVFLTAFFNFLLIFCLNLAVTHLCFSADAPLTEQYVRLIPDTGTFAELLYQISPFMMEVGYIVLNALAIALLSVFALGIHMIAKFQNRYVAFFVPFIILYATNYAEGLFLINQMQFILSIILQPKAASALTACITATDVLLIYLFLLLVDVVVLMVGFKRNREAL